MKQLDTGLRLPGLECVDQLKTALDGNLRNLKNAVRNFVANADVKRRRDGGFQMSVSRAQPPKSLHTPFRGACMAAIIPGDSIAEVVLTNGITNFLGLYNAALIGRILLTWFPQAPAVIVSPLSTLCDPYLNLFRGIIPPLGGTIDLSPILAFVVLDLFMNSAAALPAEMPGSKPTQRRGLKPLQSLQQLHARMQQPRTSDA